jgi:hypothetical protein
VIWTPEIWAEVHRRHLIGHSDRDIAKDIGTTKAAVQARRSRMLRVKVKELRPKTVGDRLDSSWDTKLFESYADRKARMARERQECSRR